MTDHKWDWYRRFSLVPVPSVKICSISCLFLLVVETRRKSVGVFFSNYQSSEAQKGDVLLSCWSFGSKSRFKFLDAKILRNRTWPQSDRSNIQQRLKIQLILPPFLFLYLFSWRHKTKCSEKWRVGVWQYLVYFDANKNRTVQIRKYSNNFSFSQLVLNCCYISLFNWKRMSSVWYKFAFFCFYLFLVICTQPHKAHL